MLSIPRLPFRDDKVFSVLVLLVLVLPLIFSWRLYEKFETIKLAFWMLSLGAILVLAAAQKNLRRLPKTAGFLAAGFLFFALLSAVFAPNHINSFFGLYTRFTTGFLFYFLFAVTLLVCLFALDKPRWQFLIKILFFDAVIVAIVGLLQSFGVGYYEGVNQAAIARAPGLLGNPNFSSMFLASVLPFSLPLLGQAKTFLAKVYYALGAVFSVLAVIGFSSRGSWVALAGGLFFGLMLAVVLKFSKKFIFFASAVCLVLLGFVIFVSGVVRPGTLSALGRLSEINIDSRLFAWDVARQAITEHPFVGVGPGNMQVYFERNRDSNLAGGGVFDDVHNLALQMAGSAGVPVALCFFALCGFALWRGYVQQKNGRDFWLISSTLSLVIWLIASCFNPVSIGCFLPFILSLAGLLISDQPGEFKVPGAVNLFSRIIGLSLSAAGVLFITSEFLFYQAQVDYIGFQFKSSLRLANAAISLNPTNQLFYLYQAADKVLINSLPVTLQADVNRIIALQPDEAKSYVLAGNLYYLMYNVHNNSSELKQAIVYMKKALALDKYSAPRYTHTAFYLGDDNQLDAAKVYLKAALSLDPKQLPGWLLLARIYQLQNNAKAMDYALNQAFKIQPADTYLKQLNETAKKTTDIKTLQIPALINFLQIEG